VRPKSALFALLFLAGAGLAGSCAHGAQGARDPRATIDTVDVDGRVATLASFGEKVVVLDVCAGWSDACLINAAELEKVCNARCGSDVAVVSLLMDQPGEPALRSYREVMGVHYELRLPGARAAAGESELGSLADIPRLVIFDRDGRVVDDIKGGVLSAAGVLRRLGELAPER
jgi:hypothetical protein